MGALGRTERSPAAADRDRDSVGWYEMALRRRDEWRRGAKGGASEALKELSAHGGDEEAVAGADPCEGSARGRKKGRLAALRELGGSSEYREWMRGRAMGECVVSMVDWVGVDIYGTGMVGWVDKLLV